MFLDTRRTALQIFAHSRDEQGGTVAGEPVPPVHLP
jgi:hypothetical protein